MPNYSIRPHIGSAPGTGFSHRFLLICLFDPNGIATIWENISTLQQYSRYKFEILNIWPGRGKLSELPASVNLAEYAGIMIHPTISYDPATLRNLDVNLKIKFKDFHGIKILAKQDEHYISAEFPRFVEEYDFDLLLTCIPEDQIAKVYSESILKRISVIHTLTGYVSDNIRNITSRPHEERPTDIAYRGSLQPISFGRLGYEKRQIGTQVLAHPASRGLALDISSRWEDRLSGLDWFAFLGAAKAILGVESGSNLFDFDGSISRRCHQFTAAHPDLDPFSDAFYQMAETEILGDHENNVIYAQISPRHFEAAATRSVQVMYEGRYSNIFEAGKHFFPLKRDMSNFEEAIDLIRDTKRAKQMIDRAYEDIILNEKYTYKNFVAEFDSKISELIEAKNIKQGAHRWHAAGKPKALIMCAHDPVTDPRIGWWASSFKSYSVCELGTYRFSESGSAPSLETVAEDHSRVRVERRLNGSVWKSGNQEAMLETPGIRDLALLEIFARSSHDELTRSIGAYDADAVDFARFKTLCEYIVNTNSSLLQAALNMGPFDAVVCSDLETLPAAVALKHTWNCHLVFDSHEYWPFSYPDFRAWESEFWSRLEARLSTSADQCITVSDTLAAHLTSEYGISFKSVPNATPLADADADWFRDRNAGRASSQGHSQDGKKVTFLFQGGFAAGRGLEMLVDAWKDVDERATLLLRGPDNEHKKLIIAQAQQNGTFDKSVFFPAAVTESDLINSASQADVGLIPYDPRLYGNKFACPNKLSQYMAAGIPIVSNTIEYVSGIIESNAAGEAVPFHQRERLIQTINQWTEDVGRRAAFGQNGRRYFESTFNWEAQSRDVIDILDEVTSRHRISAGPILLDWIEQDPSMRGVISGPRPEAARLRKLWHLMPQSLRYWLANRLRNSGMLR